VDGARLRDPRRLIPLLGVKSQLNRAGRLRIGEYPQIPWRIVSLLDNDAVGLETNRREADTLRPDPDTDGVGKGIA
jgi:hypothetical protein